MAVTFEIHLHTDQGQRLDVLSYPLIWFEAVRTVNVIGTLEVRLPYGRIPSNWLKRDYILTIQRAISGGARVTALETVYRIYKWRHYRDAAGMAFTVIYARDANDLLRRRSIAYYAQSAQASKSATAADNIIKALVRENLASTASDYASSTLRGLNATAFTVQADLGLGASTSKGCSWRRLIEVCQELAAASWNAGTYLAFDVVVRPGLGSELRTYTGQRGIDRRSGGNALTLSEASGTLTGVEEIYDYSELVTTVYAGGKGEEALRIVQSASTTPPNGPTSRIETFTTAFDGETAAYVLAEANSRLSAGRGKISFAANFQETASCVFGRDINFGDYVRAEGFSTTYDVRADTVILRMDEQGQEFIGIALKAEATL